MKEDELNEFGHGLLHKAVIHNRVDEFAHLLKIGYNINQQDELGFSPLHLASLLGRNIIIRYIIVWSNTSKESLEDEESERILQSNNDISNIDNGVQDEIKINSLTKRGQSALHLAAKNGHFETVELLLKLGCDEEILDCSRRSALDIAKKFKHESSTEILESLQCKGRTRSYIKKDCNRDDTIDDKNMQPNNMLTERREADSDVCHEKHEKMFSASDSAFVDKHCRRELSSVEHPATKIAEKCKSEVGRFTEERSENFASKSNTLDGVVSCEKLKSAEHTEAKSTEEHKSDVRKLSVEETENFASRFIKLDDEKACKEIKSAEYAATKCTQEPKSEVGTLTEEQNENCESSILSYDGEMDCKRLNSFEYTKIKSEQQHRSEVRKLSEERNDNFSSRPRTLEGGKACKELKSAEFAEKISDEQFISELRKSSKEQQENFPPKSNTLDDEDPREELKLVENPHTKIMKLFGSEVEGLIDGKMIETPSNIVDNAKDESGIEKSEQSSSDVTKVVKLGSDTEIDRNVSGVFPHRDYDYAKKMEDLGKNKLIGWSEDNTLSFEKLQKHCEGISISGDFGQRRFQELNAIKTNPCWPISEYLLPEKKLQLSREQFPKIQNTRFALTSSYENRSLLLCDACILKRSNTISAFRPTLLMGANESVAKQPASDAWEVWELNNNRNDRKRDWNSPNRLLKRNSCDSSNGVLYKTRSLPEMWNKNLASKFGWHRWKSIDLADPEIVKDFKDGSETAERFTLNKSFETSKKSGLFGYVSEECVDGRVNPINSQIEIKVEDLSSDLQTSTQLEGIDLPIICNNSTSLSYTSLPDSPIRLPNSPLRLPDSPSRLPDSPLWPRQELPNLFCDNIYQVHSDTDIFRRHLGENHFYSNRPRAWSKSTSDLSQCHLEESIDYFPCKDDSYLVTPKHGCYDWSLSIDDTGDYDRNHLTVSMKSKDGSARDDLTYSYICSENEELEGSFVCHDCGTTVPQITLNKSDNFDGRIFDQKDICSEGIADDEFVLICSTDEKEILKEQPGFDDVVQGLSGSEYVMRSLFQEGSSYNAREHHQIVGNSKKFEYTRESKGHDENEDWKYPEDFWQGNCDEQVKVWDLKEDCLRADSHDMAANYGASSGTDDSDGENNEDVICESVQRRFSRFSKQDTIFEEDSENESETGAAGAVESCEPNESETGVVGSVESCEPTQKAVPQYNEQGEAIEEQTARENEIQDQQEPGDKSEKAGTMDSDYKSTEEFHAKQRCEIIDKDKENLTSNPAFCPSKEHEAVEELSGEGTETKDQQGLDVHSERIKKIDSCQEITEEFPLESDYDVIDKEGGQSLTDSDVISNSQDVAKLYILGIRDQVSGEEKDVKVSNEKEDSIVSGEGDIVKSNSESMSSDFQYNVSEPDEAHGRTFRSSTDDEEESLDLLKSEELVSASEVLSEDEEIKYAVIVEQWQEPEANVDMKGNEVSKQNNADRSDCQGLSKPVKAEEKSSEIVWIGVGQAVGLQGQSQSLSKAEGTEHLQGAGKSTSVRKNSPNLTDRNTEKYAKAPAMSINLAELFQNDADGHTCPHNHSDGFFYGCLHCSYERGISDSTNDSLISADTGIEVDEMSVADIDEFNSILDLSQQTIDLRDSASSMISTPLSKKSTRELLLRDLRNGGRVESSGRVARNLTIDIDREEQRQKAENITSEKLPALIALDGAQTLSGSPSNEAKPGGDSTVCSAEQEANISTDLSGLRVGERNRGIQTLCPNIETVTADIRNIPDIGKNNAREDQLYSENEQKCTILSTVILDEDANISDEHEDTSSTEADISSSMEQSANAEADKPNIGDDSFEPRVSIKPDFTDDSENIEDQGKDTSSSSCKIDETANIANAANTSQSALDIEHKREEKEDRPTEADEADKLTGGTLRLDFSFDENNNPEIETKLEDLKDDEDNLLNIFKSHLKNTDKETIIFNEDESRVRMFILNFETEGISVGRRTCKHASGSSYENNSQSCCIEVLLQEKAGRKERKIHRTKIMNCFNFTNVIETINLRNCLFLKDARIVALILIRIAESSELDSSKERFAKFVCHQAIKNGLCLFGHVVNWLLVFLRLIKTETKIQMEVDISATLSLLQTLVTKPFFGLSHMRQLAYIISQPNILLSKHNETRIQFLLTCLDLELRQISFSCKYPFRTFVIVHSLLCCLQDDLENAFRDLDKQFICCLSEGNCLDFVSDVLIYLGLLKSEHPVNTTTDLGTCLRLLDHIVQQKYFPSSGAFLLTAFLKKPNELFESCEAERMQLLVSLRKIEDC